MFVLMDKFPQQSQADRQKNPYADKRDDWIKQRCGNEASSKMQTLQDIRQTDATKGCDQQRNASAQADNHAE